MAQADTRKLDARDDFPPLTLDLVGGDTLALPASRWTVFLLYRGHW
ncbi:MAG: hypothetical protein AAF533_08020 [Acidobacteriota bacterium]